MCCSLIECSICSGYIIPAGLKWQCVITPLILSLWPKPLYALSRILVLTVKLTSNFYLACITGLFPCVCISWVLCLLKVHSFLLPSNVVSPPPPLSCLTHSFYSSTVCWFSDDGSLGFQVCVQSYHL